MSSDLISRSALIAEFERIYETHYKCTVYQFIHDIFKAMFRRLKNAPAVDAVEVVRCCECKYRCDYECPMYHEEYYWDEDDGGDYIDIDNTHHDGFCDRGERREDERD